MKGFFRAPWRFAACYAAFLIAAFTWALLDTFVIPHRELIISRARDMAEEVLETLAPSAALTAPEAAADVSFYQDAYMSVELTTLRRDDTTCYVADVWLASPALLRTALAENTFGRNVTDTVSELAGASGAVLAVNGDFYGSCKSGWCLRNGVLYRDSMASAATELLLVDASGDFSVMDDRAMTAGDAEGLWQIFSFGPALVMDGEVSVDQEDEVARSMASNPREAIGQIGPLHYAFVVTDGRTEESAGLSLMQLADLMRDIGCETAYNLDGGGSSTMVFQGEVVNNPTTNGRTITEREVSDIVYIGL